MSTGFFYTEAPLQTMGKRQKLRQKNKGNKSPGERKGRDFFLSLNFFFFLENYTTQIFHSLRSGIKVKNRKLSLFHLLVFKLKPFI